MSKFVIPKLIFSVLSCLSALILGWASLITPVLAEVPLSHAPKDAEAFIISPQDGSVVSETFTVKFGLSGMKVAPAGEQKTGTGHHHLLIDLPEPPDLQTALPANDNIRHFGAAQTETELTLSPGEHTLQLVLGNYAHVPHDNPVISQPIQITVK